MPKTPIKKYALKLTVFSVIITALTVGMQLLFPDYASPALPYIVLFFFLITLFTLYIVLKSNAQPEKSRFISSYLLSRLIKFFSCLLFLFIYVILNKEDMWRFAIAFIIIYFLYSGFEVIALKTENDSPEKKEE